MISVKVKKVKNINKKSLLKNAQYKVIKNQENFITKLINIIKMPQNKILSQKAKSNLLKRFHKISVCNNNEVMQKISQIIFYDITNYIKQNKGVIGIQSLEDQIKNLIQFIENKQKLNKFIYKNLVIFLNTVLNKIKSEKKEAKIFNDLNLKNFTKKNKTEMMKVVYLTILENISNMLFAYNKEFRNEHLVKINKIKDKDFIDFYYKIKSYCNKDLNLITLLFNDPNKADFHNLNKQDFINYFTFFKNILKCNNNFNIFVKNLLEKLILDPTKGLLVLYYYFCNIDISKQKNFMYLIGLLESFFKYMQKFNASIKPFAIQTFEKQKENIFQIMLKPKKLPDLIAEEDNNMDFINFVLSIENEERIHSICDNVSIKDKKQEKIKNDFIIYNKLFKKVDDKDLNILVTKLRKLYSKAKNLNMNFILLNVLLQQNNLNNIKYSEFIIARFLKGSTKVNLLQLLFGRKNLNAFSDLTFLELNLYFKFMYLYLYPYIPLNKFNIDFIFLIMIDPFLGFSLIRFHLFKQRLPNKELLPHEYKTLQKFILKFQVDNNMSIEVDYNDTHQPSINKYLEYITTYGKFSENDTNIPDLSVLLYYSDGRPIYDKDGEEIVYDKNKKE